MLESFIGVGAGSGPRLDDTGPGPQELLAFAKNKGYFGELSAEEFINVDELSHYLGLGVGVAFNKSSPWLKFYRDGKILFISKQPLRYGLSYDALDRVGAVNAQSAIQIDGYWFYVRLLSSMGEDYREGHVLGEDTPTTHGSEWNDLIYPVTQHHANYPKNSQDTVDFESFAYAQLGLGSGNGSKNWMCELYSENENEALVRGAPGVTSLDAVLRTQTSNELGWRVCLELTFDELIAPFTMPVGVSFIDTLTDEDLINPPFDLAIAPTYIPGAISLP